MAAWVREEEDASEHRQRKREAEERSGQGCTWGDRGKLEMFQSRS